MNKEKVLYYSESYNAIKAFLFALPVFVMLIAIILVIARQIHSEAFAVIGWIVGCGAPFLFQKRYKKLFTRKVELEFDHDAFSTKEYSNTKDVLLKETTISWSQMTAYKCSFSSTGLIYLVIFLKNGIRKSFSFKDEKNQEQAMKEKSVFSIFFYYVRQYNSERQLEDNIILKPSFLTTKAGAIVLYCLAILALAGIVIHFTLAPKSFALSFMSLFIVLGLLVKRRTDKLLYNKINQLSPISV